MKISSETFKISLNNSKVSAELDGDEEAAAMTTTKLEISKNRTKSAAENIQQKIHLIFETRTAKI